MADGKTNPFGNGAGNTRGANAMPNDFTKNPGGSRAVPTQPRGENPDINAQQTPASGTILHADAVPSPSKDLGVGTIGNGDKPFRVSGG